MVTKSGERNCCIDENWRYEDPAKGHRYSSDIELMPFVDDQRAHFTSAMGQLFCNHCFGHNIHSKIAVLTRKFECYAV